MKKLSICLSICILLASVVAAQIPSYLYSEKSKVFDSYPMFQNLGAIAPEILMPSFDVKPLLEEDEALIGMDVPYRFGKAFDVKYTLNDGIWTKVDSGSVWLMKITSSGASSLNFIFNELFLPEDAKLYIYNTDGSMVYGPITPIQNLEKSFFLTDIVYGESVVLYLYVPENKETNAKLAISRIVHGYNNIFEGVFDSKKKGLGDSGDCEENVVCFGGWLSESRAVAMVLLASGTSICSGSLLNNTARDFRAYFLSAFHCADVNPENGIISSSEEYAAEHWAFRFNYKMTQCEGGQVASYFTYNNDELRAAYSTSDFILVELDESPLSHPLISFLGWDITGSTPTEATCIHHPQGDAMKLSFDDESPTSVFNDTHWFVDDWDVGSTERGSSGGPLFDQNSRVVGQDHGGDGEQPCDPDKGTYFGRLDSSWIGDGTPETRLSDWLDPCGTGATTMNTLASAYITGPEIICTSGNNPFILNNVPLGKTVTWSANSSLVTPSSGSGSFATLNATCNDIGYTTITFTLTDACGSTQIEKEFLVSGPDYSEVDLNVTYSTGQPAPKSGSTFLLCPYTYYYFYVNNSSDCSTSGYQWTFPPSITLNYTYNNMASVYTGSNPGGNVKVKATTCCSGCGGNVQILSDYVGTYWNCGGYYFSMSPNPADDYVEITIEEENDTKQVLKEYDVKIFNNMNALMYNTQTNESQLRINTKQLPSGVYYVHFTVAKDTKVLQLIVTH